MKAFVARQPIFDTNQKVFAYELLFRDGIENVFRHSDENIASSKVLMDSFHLMDIEKLTNGKIAFINVTDDILVKEYIKLFPKELIAVEILETVVLSDEIINNCRSLNNDGYTLILDDYVYNDVFDPIIEFIDIIKVDVLATTKIIQEQIINKFAPKGILMLAEKIETKEGYLEAISMGYSYFQGYFFSKPSVHSSKVIPGSKIHYFNLLQEIQQIDFDFSKVENSN